MTDDKSQCRPKEDITCPKGYGLDVVLSDKTQDSQCLECDTNEYRDTTNMTDADSQCRPKEDITCEIGRGLDVVLSDKTQNSKCLECDTGDFRDTSDMSDDKSQCKTKSTYMELNCDENTGQYLVRDDDDHAIDNSCGTCEEGFYSPPGDDVCHQCPDSMTTPAGSNDCSKCVKGFRVARNSEGDFICASCHKGFTTDGVVEKIRETVCYEDPDVCEVNQHVKNGACKSCPPFVLNERGDDPSGSDTSCDDDHLCSENFHVVISNGKHVCAPCPSGTWSHGGDNPRNNFETACCNDGEYESVREGIYFDTDDVKHQIPKVCRSCGENAANVIEVYRELNCCHATDSAACNKLKIDKDIHCHSSCAATGSESSQDSSGSSPSPGPTGTGKSDDECTQGSDCISGVCRMYSASAGSCTGCTIFHPDVISEAPDCFENGVSKCLALTTQRNCLDTTAVFTDIRENPEGKTEFCCEDNL